MKIPVVQLKGKGFEVKLIQIQNQSELIKIKDQSVINKTNKISMTEIAAVRP